MISITNDEFLGAIFGARKDDALVASFPDYTRTDWRVRKWGDIGPGRRAAMPQENTYYTISLFHPDPKGGDVRQIEFLEACYVLVLDDVGGADKEGDVKIDPLDAEMTLGKPNYIIETSPGNQHWGYIFETPEPDAGRVAAVQTAIIRALTQKGKDPGMRGVTRVVRLPEGLNNKPEYAPAVHKCVLKHWDPSRRFKLDDLGAAVNWTAVAPLPPGSHKGPSVWADMGNPRDDKVFAALEDLGMFTGQRANNGGYFMECPNAGEHSPGDRNRPPGWFAPGGKRRYKCWHGHCEKLDGDWIRDWCERELSAKAGTEVVLDFPDPSPEDAAKLAAANPLTAPVGAVPILDRFFDEIVFVADQNQFMDLRSGKLLKKEALDMDWYEPLQAVGALPAAGKGGAVFPPHAVHRDNKKGRKVDGLAYWPGEDRLFVDPKGVRYVNRWVRPARLGRGTPVQDAEIEPWLKLARHVLGCEGPAAIELGLDWFALLVGAPHIKPGWHMVMQSGQGLGKDMLIRPVITGVGMMNYGMANPADLGGGFNSWAEKRFVVIDELKQSSRGTLTGHDQYNALKRLTENTSKEIKINAKYEKEYAARNVVAIYITSNDKKALALETDDRRFAVYMAGDKVQPWPEDDYDALANWLDVHEMLVVEWLHERWAAIMQDTTRLKALRGHAPKSEGKSEMIALTEPEFPAWVREQVGDIWPDVMTSDDIQNAINSAVKSGALEHGASPHRWGAVLRNLGAEKIYKGLPMHGGTRVWAIRNCKVHAAMNQAEIRAKLAEQSAASSLFDDGKVVAITKVKDTSGFDDLLGSL